MAELSNELRELVEQTRKGEQLPSGATERMWAGVQSRLADGATTAGATTATGATTGTGLAIKLGLVALVAGAAAVAALVLRDPAGAPVAIPDSPRSVPVAPADVAKPTPPPQAVKPTAPAPAVAVTPEVEPEPDQPRPRKTAKAKPAPKPTPTSTLEREQELLRGAQWLLRAGKAEEALARLREHGREFPRGALAEMRDAQTVVALCKAGRRSEARRAAQRFFARHPGSPFSARVETSCVGDDADAPTER